MLDSQYRRVELLDSVTDYANKNRLRGIQTLLAMLAVLGIAFGIYVIFRLFLPRFLEFAPFASAGAVIVLALPVIIWQYPRFGLYLLVMSMCLFAQYPLGVDRDPFLRVPLFWNISTAMEYYGHSGVLGFMNFNLGELIMVTTALAWLIRGIVMKELVFHRGEFFNWLMFYIAWCCFGFFRGVSQGGNQTFALWELRAQFYFLLAYLMAVNMVTERKHALTIIWLLVIGIGTKSIIGSLNYLANPDVSADEGVLGHEDSLLLNIIFFGALLFSLAKVDPKLKWAFLAFVPTAVTASLANGRRAGIAAFIVAFPIVIAMTAVLLRERRKALIKFMIGFTIVAAIYLPVAWNGKGAWALPARAIRSKTAPDVRDASSDAYRLAENENLKLTRDTSPWIGYGYGRPFIQAYDMPGRTDPFKLILPHNGVLWIWMRLGHIGFVLFWMFGFRVLIRGPQILKKIRDPHYQVLGILTVGLFLMFIMYGQYDLAFANYRAMWLTGTMLGILAGLPRMIERKREERESSGLSRGSQGSADALDVRELDDDSTDEVPLLPGQRRIPGWNAGADW